ncbi:alpha/beta fold hydrolase [Cyclobacterium xiamenense]|uniref:alpha/beta fold hydrolase n=1 Tax=Cyclobacterium xiamenense TaxID=1297121 RepID=UPI0035CEDF20
MKKISIQLSGALFLVIAISAVAQQRVEKRLPNIVYIFADDLGYGDIGSFGSKDINTPHIDRLAIEGIKFLDFYSASPLCSPSRASLLTGRYPQRMGINDVFFPESFTGMPEEEITIAELLKQKGYKSAVIGKWHLGHRERYLPLQQGFDYFFGMPYSNDLASAVYMQGNDVKSHEVDQRLITKTYTDEAIRFIEQNKNQPFFLYLSHNMPHVPIYASDEFIGSSKRGLYGDAVQELDWSVGQVLNKLESENLLENTLIIFSSDNGPWLAMKELGGSAGPLREGKNYTFEGGMRVPTVAMWKGHIPEGSVHDGLATQMDWFPTIAKLTGATLPNNLTLDGKDLSRVLSGRGKRDGDSFLFFNRDVLEGYRKGDWKIKKPYGGNEASTWRQAVAPHDTLLFNIRQDPEERNNLFEGNKEVARALFKDMENECKALGDLPPSLVVRTMADNSHFEILAKSERKALNAGSIAIDGSTLEYTIEGEGIPCLVIGSSIYYPRTFSDTLRQHLKMYFVDMKWFAKGYAKEDLNQVTIETIVEDIEQIRAAVGLEKPLIMGHSIHGTMATEYVKKHGDKVSGLIVIGSPAEWGNATYQEKAAAIWETASPKRKALQEKNWGQTKEFDRLTGQKEAVARYNNMAPQYWYDPEYDAGWLWKDMTVHSEVTQHIFTRVFLDYHMFDPPVPISVPVFVGLGKYDYVIPYTLWSPSYESIPDFKLIIFEKSGHTPQLEEPEAFSAALIDWLNKPKSE